MLPEFRPPHSSPSAPRIEMGNFYDSPQNLHGQCRFSPFPDVSKEEARLKGDVVRPTYPYRPPSSSPPCSKFALVGYGLRIHPVNTGDLLDRLAGTRNRNWSGRRGRCSVGASFENPEELVDRANKEGTLSVRANGQRRVIGRTARGGIDGTPWRRAGRIERNRAVELEPSSEQDQKGSARFLGRGGAKAAARISAIREDPSGRKSAEKPRELARPKGIGGEGGEGGGARWARGAPEVGRKGERRRAGGAAERRRRGEESRRLRRVGGIHSSAKQSCHHPGRFSSRRYSITKSTVAVLARYSGPPGRSRPVHRAPIGHHRYSLSRVYPSIVLPASPRIPTLGPTLDLTHAGLEEHASGRIHPRSTLLRTARLPRSPGVSVDNARRWHERAVKG
ncbi:hypothetical protein KM043_008830 [Ampulex compressa]|nr:hypothetical protein KM043_008830 [Ampulex compressa]